ncbi:helix-turn-helix transcriptional regulator [Leucobacter aridicollis]|uniref:helix-turn-helix transcriptional regulator n=1 Tax=Leucobacter aridicollis TaxID=283878 RepID=UPI00216921B1|nr:hypothetical protein [Leucobacter aridicollis]MCS3426771.1 putative DNA-binding transcriptional regulator AlpA [Leucobacter aridicollis]
MGVESEIQALIRAEVARAVEQFKKEFQSQERGPACVCARFGHPCKQSPVEVPGYEPTWTTAQVAIFLGVKRQSIYNALSEGVAGFPRPRKNGRLNAFVPSEVAKYRRARLGF